MQTVAVLLSHRFSLFGLGTLCEVFGVDRSDGGIPPTEVRVCASLAGVPVSSDTGVQIVPRHGLDAVRSADIVAVPGAPVHDRYDPAVIDVLRRCGERGAVLMSMCSGAFVLAEAGLLDGRRCTTHWLYADTFARRYPRAHLQLDELFVDTDTPDGSDPVPVGDAARPVGDGRPRIITSAGTASGIDACLHLLRTEFGIAVMHAVAKRLVVPPRRFGGQSQFKDRLFPMAEPEALRPLAAWVKANLTATAGMTLDQLAQKMGVSTRTLHRRFKKLNTTPHDWLVRQRVERATELLVENPAWTVDRVARELAISTTQLREYFRTVVGRTPTQYRRNWQLTGGHHRGDGPGLDAGNAADPGGPVDRASATDPGGPVDRASATDPGGSQLHVTRAQIARHRLR